MAYRSKLATRLPQKLDGRYQTYTKICGPIGPDFFLTPSGASKTALRIAQDPASSTRAKRGASRACRGCRSGSDGGKTGKNPGVLPWDLWGSLTWSKGEMFMVILWDIRMLNVAYWWGFLNGAFGLDTIGRLIRDHLKGESCPLRTIVPVTERTVFPVLKSDFSLGKSPCLMKSQFFWRVKPWHVQSNAGPSGSQPAQKICGLNPSLFLAKPHCTKWGPPVISWFISPSNCSYKYHKP